MFKILKIIFLISLLGLIVFLYFSPFNTFAYWGILLVWIFIVWQLKIESRGILLVALTFFIIAASISAFEEYTWSEIIMRVGFIGLIIGFIQALREYRSLAQGKDF